MKKIAVVTDSNSGITQSEGKELGIHVLPMPFYINGELFYEDINLTQEAFYEKLAQNCEISTSQPIVGDVIKLWDTLLKEYDELVHIPMSSGLSSSCDTAKMLAQDYEGKVFVVDNQRISVTMKHSIFDALALVKDGAEGAEIRQYLEETKMESSIYITLETLKYLKKGGRITPAAAAIGTVLNLKPVLQIQGEKLDAFAKTRGKKNAKKIMVEAMQKDMDTRFKDMELYLAAAYAGNPEEAAEWKAELQEIFPDYYIICDPLSLSVSCHIGPGALAVAASRKRK